MSKKKKNRYRQRAQRAGFASGISGSLPTKGDVKNTLIETGKDLLFGVIGGGLLGAAIGKPSLLAGIGITGAGHYMNNRLVSMVGFGMMAANGFQKTGINGVDGLEGIKDRMMAFKDSFSEKLYLDKLLKKKDVAGIGSLQYFNYPDEVNGLAALDDIEQQIEESAINRLQGGDVGALNALEGGFSDAEDYNM